MAKHRSHSIEFKRQVVQEFIAGETLHALSRRWRGHSSRRLITVWVWVCVSVVVLSVAGRRHADRRQSWRGRTLPGFQWYAAAVISGGMFDVANDNLLSTRCNQLATTKSAHTAQSGT